MWQVLHDAWWRLATTHHPRSFSDVLAVRALQAGSAAYQAAVSCRNAAYDRGWRRSVRLPGRVVSVGNLTVGGTGKTACVELIARKLAGMGRRVAVLSRGYGGRRGEYWLRWDHDRLEVHGAGGDGSGGLADEPQLLAKRLPGVPVVVGPRRERTGLLACRTFGSDVLVLDDGFQHRRVRRDCDIVLVHARMPFDGWAVLPRGPMREPLSALARAQVIIITKADEALPMQGALIERLRSFNATAAFVTATHQPVGLIDAATGAPLTSGPARLEGMRVGLVSSIGDPQGFEQTVQAAGAAALWHWRFPDHHPYTAADWAKVEKEVDGLRPSTLPSADPANELWRGAPARSAGRRSRPDAIVTTEKDWIRLQRWAGPAILRGAHHTTLAGPLLSANALWRRSAMRRGGDRGPQAIPIWVLAVQMTLSSGEDELDRRLAGL